MRKIYSIALVGVFGLTIFASCKKDYTCKCTRSITGTVMGTPYSGSGDSTIALGKLKKKDAKSKCDDYQKSLKSEMDAAIALLNGSGGTVSGSISCDIEK